MKQNSKCKNCTWEKQAIINILKVNQTTTQEEIAKQWTKGIVLTFPFVAIIISNRLKNKIPHIIKLPKSEQRSWQILVSAVQLIYEVIKNGIYDYKRSGRKMEY